MKIGIIGYGVVGKAADMTFSKFFEVVKYDKYLDLDSFDLLNEVDMIFIMVPTPFNLDLEKSDESAIIESLEKLQSIGFSSEKPVVIKSTVTPGSCNIYKSRFDLEIIFNPEFLRESTTPFEDFKNQHTVVLGTDNKAAYKQVKEMYGKVLSSDTEYFHTDFITAEMIKISQNVTLASRVAVANIIYDSCKRNGADYEKLQKIGFDRFDVLGPHMVQVPGPDGKRGFGGKCLPKDINAFSKYYDSKIISQIISYNNSLRDDLV